MASEARLRANKKYNSINYDEIKVRVPKGRREIIKAYAEENGESLNSFIIKLINEAMEKYDYVDRAIAEVMKDVNK